MGSSVADSSQTKWAFEPSVGDPSTAEFDASSLALEPVSDEVGVNETISQSEAIMGSRFEDASRSRTIGEQVTGTMTYEVSPSVLTFFLKYIMGGTSSPYELAESTCYDFDYMRKDPTTTWLFKNCIIQQATFSPRNGRVGLSLTVQGKAGTIDAVFASAASLFTLAEEAYAESEVTISLAGAVRYAETWQLTINTGIELFARQSVNLNRTRMGKASVGFNANIEWTAAAKAEVYGQGNTGVPLVLTFARSGMSTVFTAPKLIIPKAPIGVDGGEMLWNFTGSARRDSAAETGVLEVTHDDTPT